MPCGEEKETGHQAQSRGRSTILAGAASFGVLFQYTCETHD